MCRTLLKPGIPYAKANRRQSKPQISMRTNMESCNPQSEQYRPPSPRGLLCMMISLAASSSPQSAVLLSWLFNVCIPLLPSKYKYPPLCTKKKKPKQNLEPSPHPSVSSAPAQHRAPQALFTTTPLTPPLFDRTLLWLSGPLCCLLSEADWRPFVCVGPCPEWPGGTCWAARGETGMRIWMGQCVLGTCWQRDGVPLWVSVHQRNHLVQLHVQPGVTFPRSITLKGRIVTAMVNVFLFGVTRLFTNLVSAALF